jgi:hypothetical protein
MLHTVAWRDATSLGEPVGFSIGQPRRQGYDDAALGIRRPQSSFHRACMECMQPAVVVLPRDKQPPRPCRLAYGARTPDRRKSASIHPSIHPSPFHIDRLQEIRKEGEKIIPIPIALSLPVPPDLLCLLSHTSLLSSLEANSSYPSISSSPSLLLRAIIPPFSLSPPCCG